MAFAIAKEDCFAELCKIKIDDNTPNECCSLRKVC